MMQGCSLRNTEYIVGAVIFTGHETKVRFLTSPIIINGFLFILQASIFLFLDPYYRVFIFSLMPFFLIILQVMMNSMNVPSKRSTLERKLDKLILALFGCLFSMCLIGAIGRSSLFCIYATMSQFAVEYMDKNLLCNAKTSLLVMVVVKDR